MDPVVAMCATCGLPIRATERRTLTAYVVVDTGEVHHRLSHAMHGRPLTISVSSAVWRNLDL